MADNDEDPSEIPFRPVPSRTGRRDGWTAERQRAFITALARCGSVSAAARQMGKSAGGAYRLCDREDAGDFARAWDEAVEMGARRSSTMSSTGRCTAAGCRSSGAVGSC